MGSQLDEVVRRICREELAFTSAEEAERLGYEFLIVRVHTLKEVIDRYPTELTYADLYCIRKLFAFIEITTDAKAIGQKILDCLRLHREGLNVPDQADYWDRVLEDF